jgi:hypothetical protein
MTVILNILKFQAAIKLRGKKNLKEKIKARTGFHQI